VSVTAFAALASRARCMRAVLRSVQPIIRQHSSRLLPLSLFRPASTAVSSRILAKGMRKSGKSRFVYCRPRDFASLQEQTGIVIHTSSRLRGSR
jgi:hypothetical protein